jgi:hypothetical protein
MVRLEENPCAVENFESALGKAALSFVVLVGGVAFLGALEAVVLSSRRAFVGAFARALRHVQVSSPEAADESLAVAAAVLAASAPVAAVTLSLNEPALGSLATSLLCLGSVAPLLASVAAGSNERARLGLHDALWSTTRRLLLLVACAMAAPLPTALALVAPAVTFELVRLQHRGPATLLPRWHDAVAPRALVVHRLGERAVAVAVAVAGAVGIVNAGMGHEPRAPVVLSMGIEGSPGGTTTLLWFVAVLLAVLSSAVVATKVSPPLGANAGFRGPLAVVGVAAAARVIDIVW